ncbi:MAG: DUF763 domain-containing protein [Candidatus Bathyarchaeia archaeon]
MRSGSAELPLHSGRAPAWLVKRMQGLSKEIVSVILAEYGPDELFRRLSDPYWFQAFGCVLGYDWHSSGVTTVVTGVLKSVLKPEEHYVAVAGGKGKASQLALSEIGVIGRRFHLSEEETRSLQYSSRMCAKVDNTAIQAGYTLYHHAIFIRNDGKWLVIQQGMNVAERAARRYHWLSEDFKSYVVEPHSAIVGDKIHDNVLNMTARESEGAQKVSVDLVNDGVNHLKRFFTHSPSGQTSLTMWTGGTTQAVRHLIMPRRIDWNALRRAYAIRPKNYEELLAVRGIGPAAVRGLALVAEVIYGERPSWRDPVKYSFAYGGKDGVPFPVKRREMERSIAFLKEAVEASKLGDRERLDALKRLRAFVPPDLQL